MYKGVILLKRAHGMSHEKFRDWLVGERYPPVPAYKKIRKYTASFYIAPGPLCTWDDGEAPFDAASEFWCDDKESVQAVYQQFQDVGGPKNATEHSSVRHAMIAEEVDILRRHWQ